MIKAQTVIVLLNYNSSKDTIDCVSTLQKLKEKIFIVIVDNNSKDPSDLFFLRDNYRNVKLILNNTNYGFSKGNNIGINWSLKNISFDYILILNNDTLLSTNTLKPLTESFLKDPKIGIVTSRIMYNHKKNIVWYGGGEINYFKGWPIIYDLNKTPSVNGANSSKYVSYISGCFMLFTYQSIKKIRGFDENFFMYGEDIEICCRAAKLDYKLYYNANFYIYHKVNSSLNKDKIHGLNIKNPNINFQFFHKKRNQFLSMKIHLSKFNFFIFNIFFWFKFIYQSIYFLIFSKFFLFITSFKTISEIRKL